MGSYGEVSEASGICLHSIRLVQGNGSITRGVKQQEADSIAYCALEMQHGINGSLSSLRPLSSHRYELPTATAKVAIGNLFQSKFHTGLKQHTLTLLQFWKSQSKNQDVGSAVSPLDSSETVCFHDNASLEATSMLSFVASSPSSALTVLPTAVKFPSIASL